MNKTLTRKFVLLVLIAVLLGVYIFQLVLTGKNKVKTISIAETPDSILIVKGNTPASPANSFRVFSENSSWYAGEKKYAVEKNTAEKMAESFKNIKLLGVISSNPGNTVEKYGLGDNDKYTVTVFKDGKALRTVVVGKDTTAGGQCYIQIDGKDTVYLAEGSFHSIYGVTIDSIRSKDVFMLSSAEIISFAVNGPNGSYILRKNLSASNVTEDNSVAQTPVWEVAECSTDSEAKCDTEKVTKWIDTVNTLKANSWAADNESLRNENLYGSVKIGTTTKEIGLSFYSIPDDTEGKFLCKSTVSPYPFYLTKYYAEKFCKNFDELKASE